MDDSLSSENNVIERCPICLDFQNCDSIIMECCDKLIHAYCLQEWLTKKNNCPLCRTSQSAAYNYLSLESFNVGTTIQNLPNIFSRFQSSRHFTFAPVPRRRNGFIFRQFLNVEPGVTQDIGITQAALGREFLGVTSFFNNVPNLFNQAQQAVSELLHNTQAASELVDETREFINNYQIGITRQSENDISMLFNENLGLGISSISLHNTHNDLILNIDDTSFNLNNIENFLNQINNDLINDNRNNNDDDENYEEDMEDVD